MFWIFRLFFQAFTRLNVIGIWTRPELIFSRTKKVRRNIKIPEATKPSRRSLERKEKSTNGRRNVDIKRHHALRCTFSFSLTSFCLLLLTQCSELWTENPPFSSTFLLKSRHPSCLKEWKKLPFVLKTSVTMKIYSKNSFSSALKLFPPSSWERKLSKPWKIATSKSIH